MKRKYAFIIFTVLILFVTAVILPAEDTALKDRSRGPEYVFFKGNTLYEEGKYDAAISVYAKLIEHGMESGALYFNLGNCYFKKGELGKAILHYERAERLIPGDSDLKANHRYALSRIKGNSADISRSLINRMFDRFNRFTINGQTILLSLLYSLSVLLLIAGMFIHTVRKYNRTLIPLLLIISLSVAFSLYGRVQLIHHEAVVIAENAEAGFEPLDNATVHFTLYEGMKIQILEPKKDWVKIKRGDGKIGWIRQQDIEKI